VTVSGYQSSSNVYDFAIVDAGWDGGIANRIIGFSVDVIGGTLLSEPPSLFTLFTDNMVLQRNAAVAVFGTAAPTNELTVTFAGQTKVTTSDTNGNWSILLDPMSASFTPRTLTVLDGTFLDSVTNVLVGDVWLASGQSNMDRPISSFATIEPTNKVNSNIRIMNIATATETNPVDVIAIDGSLNGSWQECGDPDQLDAFSPAAYFFSSELQDQLDIPIGIIESAVGGTKAEKWTPSAKMAELGYVGDPDYSVHYNGMIYPLRNFTFKGVIWYQGESNASDPLAHTALFQGLIESWRDAFGRGDIPFYFAQIAPYGNYAWDVTAEGAAWMRESQAAALVITNTRMVVTIDIGEYGDIHPQDKPTVGHRFALHALEAEEFDVVGSSPMVSSMQINGDEATLSFSNADSGLEIREVRMNKNIDLSPGTDPEAFVVSADTLVGFTICGESGIFVAADATITGNQVVVSSPYVPNPVAVRYAWASFALCNLYAVDGLPVAPFRTDSFEMPSLSGDFRGELYSGDESELGEVITFTPTAGTSTNLPVTIDEVDGYETSAALNRFAYFSTTNSDLKNGQTPEMAVEILYYDQGDGTFTFRYDAESDSLKYAPASIVLSDSGQWRVATIILDDAFFANRLSGYDLRVQSDNTDFIIGGVYLTPFPGGTAYQEWSASFAISGDQNLDFDNDRQTNLDEFQSGTNPSDTQSALKIEGLVPSTGNEILVQWQSVSGKSYKLLKSTTLSSNGWETVGSSIAATEPLNTTPVSVSATNAFFKIELE
jgi:sialate O-acetylesterase